MELKGASSCQTPMITEPSLMTSNSFDETNLSEAARISSNNPEEKPMWCPSFDLSSSLTYEWVQINFGNLTYLTKLEIKYRSLNDNQPLINHYHLSSYRLEYTRDKYVTLNTTWKKYHSKIKHQNHDSNTTITSFDPPIIATNIRLIPDSQSVCLKLELFGCPFTDGVVSYSMPQGVTTNLLLEDETYDGQYDVDRKYLSGGLGQLSDGQTGADNYRENRGYKWVGWHDNHIDKKPISIIFNFDYIRNFSRLTIHTNNYYTKGIYVFRSAVIKFSRSEQDYKNVSSIFYDHQRDENFDLARPVMIDLKYHVGSSIQLDLYFDGNWLLISEVTFDSFIVDNIERIISTTPISTLKLNRTRKRPLSKSFEETNIKSMFKNKYLFDYDELLTTISPTIIRSGRPLLTNIWVYLIVCLSAVSILLIMGAIILLFRRTRTSQSSTSSKKHLTSSSWIHQSSQRHYFQPISSSSLSHPTTTTTTNSSTSEDIETVHEQHHGHTYGYATIKGDQHDYTPPVFYTTYGTTSHQHLYCSSCYSPSKTMTPIKMVLPINHEQSPHIQGVCGNSQYYTQRLLGFDLARAQFIPSSSVELKQKLGSGQFGGEIYQGELQLQRSENTTVPVVIRRLNSSVSMPARVSFFNEISLLTSLCHLNILHSYGFCSEPVSLITEYIDTVDLYQYLRYYRNKLQSVDQNVSNLYSTVYYFGRQITSALNYLESFHVVHRDLAARNCLVCLNLTIKLQDLAMCKETYKDDYYPVEIGEQTSLRPIRWCAWETICYNHFSSKSDVYSFGVLLWEILTTAEERPHALLDDEQVLTNLKLLNSSSPTSNIDILLNNDIKSSNSNFNLSLPNTCPLELFKLIHSCWNKFDYNRPTFREIDYFFQQTTHSSSLLQQQQQQQKIVNDNNNGTSKIELI
ncbi:unnamed protein product [Didymodactylos carnosus]|uniref:Discoidin domain-containing receptor 2-like n=1 Tax=Didymodactylos carnosus TaxID=1234261 RepID=A0A8S2CPR6_9BILA|nr:unnamed protein product [Didymodactylos carnosus]CAF3514189.1 unnamed protein product [Didymodactylos carnosus]